LKAGRKSSIEFVRFIASICILMGHATILKGPYGRFIRPWPRGYIFVEFFYMLTGCFCAAHVDNGEIELKNAMRYAANYTLRKILRILPFAIIGVIICYIWRFIYVEPSYSEGIKLLLEAPFEFLLLNITGLSDVYLNAPMWYLSIMLLVLPVVMYGMIRFSDVFRNYLSWVLPVVFYGYLISTFGALDVWGNSPIYLVSAIRATAGLSLGACCYYIAEEIKNREPHHPIFFGVLEIVILFVVLYASYTNEQVERIDMFIVLLFFFLIILSYSGITFIEKKSRKFELFLGRISSPIYCLHWGMLVLSEYIFSELPFFPKLCITIAATFLLSIVILLLFNCLHNNNRLSK